MKTIAIIVAGGRGKRMGKPKQFLKIAGRPMLAWTLRAFQESRVVDGIILVVAKDQVTGSKKLKFSKVLKVVVGGKERQDSVRNGLRELPESAEIVLIHDGARPAVTEELIEKAVKAARSFGTAVIGVPVKDTVKLVAGSGSRVARTLNRKELWQAQTPQVFKAALIRKAYAKVRGKFTDDAMLVERLGIPVKMIPGSYENFKITTPEDLELMEAVFKSRRRKIGIH